LNLLNCNYKLVLNIEGLNDIYENKYIIGLRYFQLTHF